MYNYIKTPKMSHNAIILTCMINPVELVVRPKKIPPMLLPMLLEEVSEQ